MIHNLIISNFLSKENLLKITHFNKGLLLF